MNFKTFMIYNEYYLLSKKNMQDSIRSYDSTWQIEAYNGCAPDTLDKFEKEYPLPQTDRYKKFVSEKKYISKKCCFYSHYSLWEYCAKNLDFIVIVENDVESGQPFPANLINNFARKNTDSFGIQITTESMTLYTKRNKKHYKEYTNHLDGIHPIYHKNSTGKKFLIGATGYILNNSACKYLLQNCQQHGWSQNDLLFNADEDFDLYFIKPSIANYIKGKENNTSSNL